MLEKSECFSPFIEDVHTQKFKRKKWGELGMGIMHAIDIVFVPSKSGR